MSNSLKAVLSLPEIRRLAGKNFDSPEPNPPVSHEVLVDRGRVYPTGESERRATVTAFSDWVYNLHHHPKGRSPNARVEESYRQLAAFILGKQSEPEIVEELVRKLKIESAEREAQKNAAQKTHVAEGIVKAYKKVGWILKYDGTSGSSSGIKVIDELLIGNIPLRARPDLVIQDHESGDLLIIEIKTWESEKSYAPRYEWPNLKVQLWCYGLIKWGEVPHNVYLLGHVHQTSKGELTRTSFHFDPWRSDDPRRHREALELFEVFGGRHVPPLSSR